MHLHMVMLKLHPLKVITHHRDMVNHHLLLRDIIPQVLLHLNLMVVATITPLVRSLTINHR